MHDIENMFFLRNRKKRRWQRIKDSNSSMSNEKGVKLNRKSKISEYKADRVKKNVFHRDQEGFFTTMKKKNGQTCTQKKNNAVDRNKPPKKLLRSTSGKNYDKSNYKNPPNTVGNNSIPPNSAEELENGGSDKQLQNILIDLRINDCKRISREVSSKKCEDDDEQIIRISNITMKPKMRYEMVDSDKNAKVFLSLKKEKIKRVVPSERRRIAENDTVYGSLSGKHKTTDKRMKLEELKLTGSYDSISSCTLDSSLLIKKHTLLPSWYPSSSARQHSQTHRQMKESSKFSLNSLKKTLQQNGDTKPDNTTFFGLVDEWVSGSSKVLSQWFGKCIIANE